jgi:hypothetical protein
MYAGERNRVFLNGAWREPCVLVHGHWLIGYRSRSPFELESKSLRQQKNNLLKPSFWEMTRKSEDCLC